MEKCELKRQIDLIDLERHTFTYRSFICHLINHPFSARALSINLGKGQKVVDAAANFHFILSGSGSKDWNWMGGGGKWNECLLRWERDQICVLAIEEQMNQQKRRSSFGRLNGCLVWFILYVVLVRVWFIGSPKEDGSANYKERCVCVCIVADNTANKANSQQFEEPNEP